MQKADTDNDGLTDYEEIKLYNTDSLKTDTDGDGIPDGDELSLGLDPKNPATHGVPDAEYKVEQEIPAESKVLEKINTEENPYRLSVEVKASGYVEGSLEAKETKYAVALENEFMVGVASELSCTNEYSIEEVTLSFEIDEAYIDNAIGLFPEAEELSGIKRFNVFKYFEDINMLLPIEMEVDVENNRIYAKTDELGTYCVMDMELWLASFDVPEGVYQEATTFFMATERATENSGEGEIRCDINGIAKEITEIEKIVPVADVRQDKTMLFTLNREAAVTPIDVVFLLQSSGQLPDTFDSQKAMLVDLLSVLNEQYGEENVRFRVIMYNLSGVEMLASESGELWFADDSKLASALANIEYQYTSDYTVRGGAFEALQSVEFKENASKFAVQIMNGSTLVGTTYFQQINSCVQLGINYSELIPEGYVYSNPDYKQQVEAAIASTNGMSVIYRSNTPQVLYDHIVAYTVSPQTEFDAIVPTGWKHIVLDGVLDPDNGVNSDTDELTDWEEIDTERICWEEGGTIILPTIQECIDFAEEPYAKDGLARFKTAKQVPGMPSSDFYKYLDYVLNSTRILPLFSDPTAEDSDGDGLLDLHDPRPLSAKNYGENHISMENEDVVTLLQQCLVYLGYLDMKGNSYGTFGGLTSAAVQLYQVNHRMYSKNEALVVRDIEDETKKGKYVRSYWLDEITYYSIICEAVNCGYLVSNDDVFNIQSVENAFAFFENVYVPKSVPLETINVSKNVLKPVYIESVDITSQEDFTNIYVYDLTVPLEAMLKQGAKEFHLHHYWCNSNPSWFFNDGLDNITYNNSSAQCKRKHSDYMWLISQVANGKRYDVKVEKCWESFFDDLNMEVPYYHSSYPFIYNSEEINAEKFGNILYGYAGHAGGYSCEELEFGGSFYSLVTTGKRDDKEDSDNVTLGYSLYEKAKKDYNFLHVAP